MVNRYGRLNSKINGRTDGEYGRIINGKINVRIDGKYDRLNSK